MSGAIPPLPQYVPMAWVSVKAQEQLYLYLYMMLNIYPWLWVFIAREYLYSSVASQGSPVNIQELGFCSGTFTSAAELRRCLLTTRRFLSVVQLNYWSVLLISCAHPSRHFGRWRNRNKIGRKLITLSYPQDLVRSFVRRFIYWSVLPIFSSRPKQNFRWWLNRNKCCGNEITSFTSLWLMRFSNCTSSITDMPRLTSLFSFWHTMYFIFLSHWEGAQRVAILSRDKLELRRIGFDSGLFLYSSWIALSYWLETVIIRIKRRWRQQRPPKRRCPTTHFETYWFLWRSIVSNLPNPKTEGLLHSI